MCYNPALQKLLRVVFGQALVLCMRLDPVETVQRLVAIPSVNPLGCSEIGEIHGEGRLTDHLQKLCESFGWRWLRQEVHPGRENLLALVPGSPSIAEGGEFQLWDVHQDTVAIDGMSVAPFGGEVRQGRVYGRGACDDKGPMAAMIAALSRAAEQPTKRRPTIVIAFPVNEECGFTGARAMCDLWLTNPNSELKITGSTISPGEMFPRPPDLAIVAEPTDLNVVVAHQGVVRWRCHATGRAAHSSRPDEGINAIYAIGRVAHAVEDYQRELAQAAGHPLCGKPSVCVTTVHGGVGYNTVPDHVTISFDRRIGPGDNPAAAYADLVRYIAQHAATGVARVDHDPPFMQSSGLSDENNGPLAERLVQLVRDEGRESGIIGAPYGTDAAAFCATGVPTVVFGPGSVHQAHTADEFIEIGELERGTAIFTRIATDGLR